MGIMNAMIATFVGTGDEVISISHRKEKNYSGGYIGIVFQDGIFHKAVDLRYYWTSSRCYCCVWTHKERLWISGSGYAGGYGYHIPSAAAEEAISKAGWKLTERIDGRGDDAVEEAVRAITQAMYPEATNITVIKVHG